MNKLIIVLLTLISGYCFGQSSVNSGAVSGNDLVYSVGEIFTLPINPDDASSGTAGSVSYIEFFTVGVDEVLTSEDVRIYPNPTTGSLQFKADNINSITTVQVYDNNGKLIMSRKPDGNRIDITELGSGIYFIKTNVESIKTFKIIKQ